VIARNSHSMGIISDYSSPPKHYLVVYGGASPEHGPLGDTLYAELPEVAAIGESQATFDYVLAIYMSSLLLFSFFLYPF